MKSSSRLNLFDLTMIVVSLVIGMGIFRTPVNVAQQAGSADMFFLAWIVGGLIALCRSADLCRNRAPVSRQLADIIKYFHIVIIPPLHLPSTASFWCQMRLRWPAWH